MGKRFSEEYKFDLDIRLFYTFIPNVVSFRLDSFVAALLHLKKVIFSLIVMLLYCYSVVVMLLYRYSLIDQSRGGCGIEALTGVHYGSVTTGVVGTYRWQYKCSGNDLLLAKHVALTGSTGLVWLLICQRQPYDYTVCFEIPLVNSLARLLELLHNNFYHSLTVLTGFESAPIITQCNIKKNFHFALYRYHSVKKLNSKIKNKCLKRTVKYIITWEVIVICVLVCLWCKDQCWSHKNVHRRKRLIDTVIDHTRWSDQIVLWLSQTDRHWQQSVGGWPVYILTSMHFTIPWSTLINQSPIMYKYTAPQCENGYLWLRGNSEKSWRIQWYDADVTTKNHFYVAVFKLSPLGMMRHKEDNFQVWFAFSNQ